MRVQGGWCVPTCQLANFSICRLFDLSGSWRVGGARVVRVRAQQGGERIQGGGYRCRRAQQEGVIAVCSDCIVCSLRSAVSAGRCAAGTVLVVLWVRAQQAGAVAGERNGYRVDGGEIRRGGAGEEKVQGQEDGLPGGK